MGNEGSSDWARARLRTLQRRNTVNAHAWSICVVDGVCSCGAGATAVRRRANWCDRLHTSCPRVLARHARHCRRCIEAEGKVHSRVRAGRGRYVSEPLAHLNQRGRKQRARSTSRRGSQHARSTPALTGMLSFVELSSTVLLRVGAASQCDVNPFGCPMAPRRCEELPDNVHTLRVPSPREHRML